MAKTNKAWRFVTYDMTRMVRWASEVCPPKSHNDGEQTPLRSASSCHIRHLGCDVTLGRDEVDIGYHSQPQLLELRLDAHARVGL